MAKLQTCLWFDRNAEEAVEFYKSVFPDVRVQNTVRFGKSFRRILNPSNADG